MAHTSSRDSYNTDVGGQFSFDQPVMAVGSELKPANGHALMSYIVRNTSIHSIFVCFLEKGHTENTADSVHNKIEAAKLVSISAPSEWPMLFPNISTGYLRIDLST